MATTVLAAALELPVFVVCDDDDVAAFAHRRTVPRCCGDPGSASTARWPTVSPRWAALGYDRVLVAHADLPLAVDLAWLARLGGVTLVPDRHDDGTNVVVPPLRHRLRVRLRSRLVPPPRRRGAAPGPGRPGRCGSRRSAGTSTSPTTSSHPSLQGVLPSLPTSPANHC